MPLVLDAARLAELGEDLGDLDFLAETVGIYLTELPGRHGAMRDAFAIGDRDRLRAGAHSLGSASALVGALELELACREMELRATQASPAELTALYDRWSASCGRTETAVRGWLEGQGSNR